MWMRRAMQCRAANRRVESPMIAHPGPVLRERVQAFITRKGGATITESELRAFCAARLADYKVPETVTLLDEPLRRNANGKLPKRVLRKRMPPA